MMKPKLILGLLCSFAIFVFPTGHGYADSQKNDFCEIVSPGQAEVLNALPVEIIVTLREDAIPETFTASLNQNDITDKFVPNGSALTALVSVQDGLVLKVKGGKGKKSNTLKVEIDGTNGKHDVDNRTFFVQGVPAFVPSLLRLTQAEAEAAIEEAILIVGTISEEKRVSVPTGRVINQNPLPGTEVEAGSSVDFTVVAPPPSGVQIPEAWAGEWRFKITYYNSESGNKDGVYEITNAICPYDPVGIALLEEVADGNAHVADTSCTTSASEDHIEASCSGQLEIAMCTVEVGSQFLMHLDGDTLAGTGGWTAANNCGLTLPSEGQAFDITGIRLSSDTGGLCEPPVSSLLQKFMRNSLLIYTGGQL